jgi:hypothetical protein
MAKEMQEIMFAHVKSWQSKDMTKKAFAQSIGVTKDKFDYWLKKYMKLHGAENSSPAFIQLEPPIAKPKPGPKASVPSKLEMELSLPSGICLKIYS